MYVNHILYRRMDELIEAGTQGLLSEEMFEKALMVNDAVARTLDAERVSYLSLTELCLYFNQIVHLK